MGSSGSRRRVERSGGQSDNGPVPTAPAGDPVPPVMWPDAGSGFEADPFSPAGSLQREAMFLRGLSGGGGRVGRAALWVVLGVVAVVAFSLLVTFLIHHG